MKPWTQVYLAFAVALAAFICAKIEIKMETVFIIILAALLCVSLFFNYRLYCAVRAYQNYCAQLVKKSLVQIVLAGVAGLLWGKIIADRIAGRDE